MKKFLVFFFVALLPLLALAQVVDTPPTADDWQKFVEALGGLKGAGVLAIVAAVVQGLMLLLRSPLGAVAGKFKLLVLTVLTTVAGIIALRITGLDWASVFMHSSTLIAYQVLFHQVYVQFFQKTS